MQQGKIAYLVKQTKQQASGTKVQKKKKDTLEDLIYELNSRSMVEVTDNIVISKTPEDTEWTTGTSITVEENNTTVYVRLYSQTVDHETAVNNTTTRN